MAPYISFASALQTFALSYLVSVVLVIALSYIGWVIIEIMEESNEI
ncbi:hypothetical protein [Floridanema evergladense]|uniref:Uncharacterized protein n=1 Tax=Floridaenema evergladense BLCC-F167 TaxID=3153639 RepID=A0ABV4WR01_9CYAN